jgi:hypothetical protein
VRGTSASSRNDAQCALLQPKSQEELEEEAMALQTSARERECPPPMHASHLITRLTCRQDRLRPAVANPKT